VRSLLEHEQQQQQQQQHEQSEQSEQSEQLALGAAGTAGAAARAQRGGAAALRPILMDDFVLAKQTLRVSTAMDTCAAPSIR
jgi:hypothetical protein